MRDIVPNASVEHETTTATTAMAQKLNKKLVFVVGSLLIAVVVGGAGIFLIRYRTDADRHIRAGDTAMAAGEFTKAAESYGRAVQKKRTNVEYLEKFLDATLKVRSTTENDARERYGQSIAALGNLAAAQRGDLTRWRTYLAALVEQAEALGTVSVWKALSETTKELAQASAPGSPGQAVAAIYSGYASLRRIESLDDNERADAVAKLKDAAGADGLTPAERDLAYGTIARIAITDLARARTAGVAARIEAASKTVDAALSEAQRSTNGGVQTAIAVFERALVDARGNASDPALLEKIESLRATAEAANLKGLETLNVAGVLSRGGAAGVRAAAALLEGSIARDPNALMQRRARAMLIRPLDRDAALQEIDAAIAIERPATGIVAASFEGNRLSCALIRFDILFDAVESAEGAARNAALVQATAARDEIAKQLTGVTDDSALLRADAKLAMARREFQQAIIKLNEIFKKGSAIDLELYVLSAMCSVQIGETGRALDLVSSGLQLAPSNPELLKLRAQLELRTGRPADALATVRLVRTIAPSDKEAEEAERRIAAALASDPGTSAGLAMGGEIAQEFGRVQAALDAKNYALARQLVGAMRSGSANPDIRAERLAAIVEMQAGDDATARAIVTSALQKFPGDASLTRLNAVLSTDDAVERVIVMTEAAGADEKMKPILIYLSMMQSAAAVSEMAERDRRLGAASAAQSEKAAKRLAEGVIEWRAKAEAVDPLHPVLVEADFREALRIKNYDAASAVVKRARESGRDAAQIPLLEAQILIEQGKLRDAAALLERAIQSGIDTSSVYRTLGSVIEQQGNIEGAIRQYEEAYERRPDDMQTVRLYVGANVRNGNLQKALEVLRAARQLAGLDEEIANVWLTLETQVGDRRLAMALRENQYRATPADIRNAVALAVLLGSSVPERADILTEGGQPAYTDAAWQSLTESQRNATVDQLRSSWRRRAEEIFASSLKRVPSSIDVAEPYSVFLRSLGRNAEAERVVKDAVTAGGADAGWRGYVVLGNVQLQIDKRDDAKASFDEAIRREDPTTRDATRTVIETLLAQERYGLAQPFLEDLARTDSDPAVKFRLAEALMRNGNLDEARAVFATVQRQGTERQFGDEILEGALAVAMGDRLRSEGKMAEAKASYESALAPFQRAKAIAPSNVQPFIQDAIAKRRIFEVGGDRNRLQEALAAADKAVSLSVTFFPSCVARADVLLAGGDVAGALMEYERFLKLVPTSVDARRRFVDLATGSGDLQRAESSLRAAIGFAPGEASWHYALGELLSLRSRFADASAAFARADALRPEPVTFLRELDARIRAKDFRGVREAVRRRGDFVRENSTARALTGVALVADGESGDGIKTLKEAYQAAIAASTAADDRLVGEWFATIDLLYAPTELAQAESLMKDVIGVDLSPRARLQLSSLALRSPSDGPQKVLEYLLPIAGTDFTASPGVGAAVLDRLGTAHYLAGDCAKAIDAFEKALVLAPNSDSLLNNFAYLCGECLQDTKRGLPAARRAVALNPGRGEYLDTLGALLIIDGAFAEALELLDRAALITSSAAIQCHRAQALAGLGRKAEARAACEKALGMNPDPPTRAKIDRVLQELK